MLIISMSLQGPIPEDITDLHSMLTLSRHSMLTMGMTGMPEIGVTSTHILAANKVGNTRRRYLWRPPQKAAPISLLFLRNQTLQQGLSTARTRRICRFPFAMKAITVNRAQVEVNALDALKMGMLCYRDQWQVLTQFRCLRNIYVKFEHIYNHRCVNCIKTQIYASRAIEQPNINRGMQCTYPQFAEIKVEINSACNKRSFQRRMSDYVQ